MLSRRIGREGSLQTRPVFLSAIARETEEVDLLLSLCITYMQTVWCVREIEVGMTRKEGGRMSYS